MQINIQRQKLDINSTTPQAPVEKPISTPKEKPSLPQRDVPHRRPAEKPYTYPPADPDRRYRTCNLPDLETL